ncbi:MULTISPECIES: autotransporter outer membrane beta-barrel domain-containing protein [unclassified Mesorhizobium]|uniref:autotransporter outer membrane beta-barrel domain-containing protein n=1 Tax=unclassified Mesorhizobium TaxID=325217 RepID=UPI00112DA68C|nr:MULTISPECIES: autotransporter outer membrane beta-barrel domain-containing protein [unclassified Mesorhizobium]MBZ9894421.1 autotransporter outer membrane beta-barrel domain-containing protein [Mesorhizobium sp. BR1-1-6]TPM57625.1 autotransporter outer membrane beta-barrel domain-containing protein [Mesorhizobium sp. B2-2-4]TPM65572.1 autotransporter outer membrane beta-barrel domain-containing protein [Mesorhizobium sp. B2-2-1]TPN38518.1 autotransporter outer membrane beta-barrel domain-con
MELPGGKSISSPQYKMRPASADYDLSSWKFRAGVDKPLAQTDGGELVGGVSLNFGTYSADVSSPSADGSVEGKGYGVGGTLTWYATNGFYVDRQAQVTWFDSDLDSNLAGRMADNNKGVGYALSIEAGKRIALTQEWLTTPQAQLICSAVNFDDFTDVLGAPVSLGSVDNLTPGSASRSIGRPSGTTAPARRTGPISTASPASITAARTWVSAA